MFCLFGDWGLIIAGRVKAKWDERGVIWIWQEGKGARIKIGIKRDEKKKDYENKKISRFFSTHSTQ
jgi:hypothetical protein